MRYFFLILIGLSPASLFSQQISPNNEIGHSVDMDMEMIKRGHAFTYDENGRPILDRSKLPGYSRKFNLSPITKNSKFLKKRNVSPDYISKKFQGEFANKGQEIIDVANEHDLDPLFFSAILAIDTSWGEKKLKGSLQELAASLAIKSKEKGFNPETLTLERYLESLNRSPHFVVIDKMNEIQNKSITLN
jgi:hypothetical protein